MSGCSRRHYREHADRDVYNLIAQNSLGTPWELPETFSIDPEPESRLHDPSDPDFPVLPHPGPNLYGYELPISGRGPVPDEPGPEEAAAPAPAEAPPTQIAGLPIQPIPETYWDAVPRQCLARMLEFESVLEEYRKEYEDDPPDDLLDPSPRLSLENILELALLNSREYQGQKERLYSAALALTLERFDYVPKFNPGDGADVDYTTDKVDGATLEGMNINSGIGLEKMLATGGSLLARFANQVVFTFEGPEGWSKDVSSELFFNFSQSLFQRDIRFNSLIEAL